MGRTPLFYAAYYCNVFAVNYLIDKGASTTLLDYAGFLLHRPLTRRMDALQYAKSSTVSATNEDKCKQKEKVLALLCAAHHRPESAHCQRMNAAISRVREEIQIPTTARDLGACLSLLSSPANCILTTSRSFFALYSEYSKDDEGIHLTKPHFLVKQITVASECRFPHFQLFEEGCALLMAYELTATSNHSDEAGSRTKEQCIECFDNACKMGLTTWDER